MSLDSEHFWPKAESRAERCHFCGVPGECRGEHLDAHRRSRTWGLASRLDGAAMALNRVAWRLRYTRAMWKARQEAAS